MEKEFNELFPPSQNNESELLEHSYLINYRELLLSHLKPELLKRFIQIKQNVTFKNFLEAAQYEYGLFNTKIDLKKAYFLYKKYADSNDYFCMYKMHIIHLSEFKKFNVKRDRILEKLYLLKCFAYLPNFIFNFEDNLFHKIDVLLELAYVLDNEDSTASKHKDFINIIEKEKKKFNLTGNDISLMRFVFSCYFGNEESGEQIMSFYQLKAIKPESNLDLAYFEAMNKSVYFRENLKLETELKDEEIIKFYKKVIDNKLYQYYSDYGNYLLNKSEKVTIEIMTIFKESMEQGNYYSRFKYYQCLLTYTNFNDFLNNKEKAFHILNILVDEIACENLSNTQFIMFVALLIKHSKFSKDIIQNFVKYVKEIYEYTLFILDPKNEKFFKSNFKENDIEYFWRIRGFVHYFGFDGIEKKDRIKAIEYLEKSSSLSQRSFIKRENEYFIYKAKKYLYKTKKISEKEFLKSKEKLAKICLDNTSRSSYNLLDCYIVGKMFWEGIGVEKDYQIVLLIYKKAISKKLCIGITDKKERNKIELFLKKHSEITLKINVNVEICCICYDHNTDTMLFPCKHYFCGECVKKLEENGKCPVCRGEILCDLRLIYDS